jgi:hypothetical protein
MPSRSVSLIRKKAEHLGTVTATNDRQAIEKAAKLFDIPSERQNRIVVTKISEKDD